MGTSQSQYRPHSYQNYNSYFGPTWGQPHHVAPNLGNGLRHHYNIRPGFGFNGPRPHLRRRC
jgi:hypothetical protein